MTRQLPYPLALEKFRWESQLAIKRQPAHETVSLGQLDIAIANIAIEEFKLGDTVEKADTENPDLLLTARELGNYSRVGMQGLAVTAYNGYLSEVDEKPLFGVFAINAIRTDREKKFGLVTMGTDTDSPIKLWRYAGEKVYLPLDNTNDNDMIRILQIREAIVNAGPEIEEPNYL